jgi:molybdopterin-guanine dinucleotide biosynthesis protein A
MPAIARPGNAIGATAIVLAGGRSSRMGSPKALLLFDDKPLIVHIVATLQRLFAEVVVAAAPGQSLPSMPVTVVRDDVEYQGPVGGIYYGLRAVGGDVSFVTSCDSAFLNPDLVSHLVSQIPEHDVVVPHWQGRYQPLHAVYRRSVGPLLGEQLARGRLKPVHLFDRVRTRRIDEEEIRRFDPDGSSFFNMNTPEDYAEARRRWSHARQPPGRESTASIHCTVELFGAARFLAHTREVSLTLPMGATFSQVFAALAEKLPVLVGHVIDPDRARLFAGYACNVNGLDFIRTPTATVNSGDNIVILSADAGG